MSKIIALLVVLCAVSPYMYSSGIQDSPTTGSRRENSTLYHREPFFEGMGVDVGLLREQWTLPSDHLPIGLVFPGATPIRIASWNVLNSGYMKFIQGDYQGLVGSTITQEDVSLSADGFTLREQHIVDLILQMSIDSDNGQNIIALQECGQTFLQHLTQSLPSHMRLIYTDESAKDQSVFLYDATLFDCTDARIKKGLFSDRPSRAALDIRLQNRKTGEQFRCVTAHLPWIPGDSGVKEFAAYLRTQLSSLEEDETLVVMGDMNKTEIEIESSFRQAGLFGQQISPYCTYIPYLKDGVYTQTANVDHLMVFGSKQGQARAALPDEVLSGLDSLVNLLHGTN